MNIKSENITAVIPALNEEVSIGSVILRTKKYVDRIIVIDDGSADRTSEVARLAGAEVIRHPENLGKGAALKTGFRAATLNGTRIILTLDADGQHDPDEIPGLVKDILEGNAEMVIGSRYLNGNGKNTPKYRRTGQTVLDKATNFNSRLHLTDTQSGFRAFVADKLSVFRLDDSGLAIESEMLADAAEAGLRIKEAEIHVRYDVNNSKENPIKHGVHVLVKILHDIELHRPLYYFTVSGVFLMIIGILIGIHYFQLFRAGGQLPFGPTLFFVMLVLIGTLSSFTGLILHSMSRLLKESRLGGRK